MYAVIYKKIFIVLPTEPPTTPANASNEGQIFSGTNNSLWQSTKESTSVPVIKWQIVPTYPPEPPSRNATSSDVGVEVTASDGSIWTGVSSGGSGLTWQSSGTTTNESLTVVTGGASCSSSGAKGRSDFGFEDPGNPSIIIYNEYTCQDTPLTYSWQFVRRRKLCATCPPETHTYLGDQCLCDSNVYELKNVTEIETTYYWKKIKDDSTLILEANSIIKDVSVNITKRAYEMDTGSVEGFIEQDIDEPFIFELKDDDDKSIYSGFIKNWKWENGLARFNIEDFRTTIDTDVILDYSHGDTDFRLYKIFEKVTNAIESGSFLYGFNIPVDEIDTVSIGDYSDQYIIVNALKFLKTYLSYYNYVIDKHFDYNLNKVMFTFRKQDSNTINIHLDDFIHEKTKNDIKTNQVMATIQFQTIYEVDSEWQETTQIAWETAAIENKSTIMAEELPALEGYTKDHIIRLIKNVHFTTITESQYNALDNKLEEVIDIPSGQGGGTQQGLWDVQDMDGYTGVISPNAEIIFMNPNPNQGITNPPPIEGISCNIDSSIYYAYYYIDWATGKNYLMYLANCNGFIEVSCPTNAPSSSVINSLLDAKDYEYNTGIKIQYRDSNGMECGNFTYVKVYSTDIEYYSKGGTVVVPRPTTLANKVYSLGSDNNIYEGKPPSDLMIYPIKREIFEAETLAKAQVDAIYSLVNNRWNENIIIDSKLSPADLKDVPLLQQIKVFDKNGDIKILPVSEITVKVHKSLSYMIKLGFKKELFTQIYKSDTSQGVLK